MNKVSNITLAAISAVAVGWTSFALTAPSSTSSRLQLAEDERANCQLLANNATSSAQRTRANNCVNDQSRIISLLTTASPTPSPTPTPTPTPSPTPSPTPTGTVLNCRNRLSAAGCGYPDATNTGPIPGTIFTTLNGNQSFNTQGQTVENVVINGCVEVHANNVTINNSIINANGCFYGVRNFATSLNLNNVEITCGGENGTGVTSNNYTVVGANIHNCENGFNVSGNVVVRDTYVHDMETDNGAHTDGAQFNQGAANILFTHNTLITPTPGGTSAIIMWDEGNPQNSGVTIQDNFLIGGTYTLYCPRMNATNIVIINNRFGEFEFGNVNSCIPGHVTTFTGNFRDTGGPVSE